MFSSYRALATSKFQPTDARRAFPCFDEPNLKATYITTLVHDKKYIALSNMDVEVNYGVIYVVQST